MRYLVLLVTISLQDAASVMQCGRSANRAGKIVGGDAAREGDFPWQASEMGWLHAPLRTRTNV